MLLNFNIVVKCVLHFHRSVVATTSASNQMMSDLEASNLDLNNDDMPFSTTVTPATDDGDETFVSESMIKLSATVEQVMAEANRLEMR